MTLRRLLARIAATAVIGASIAGPAHAQAASLVAGPRVLDFEAFNGVSSQGCGGNTIASYGGLDWSGIGWASVAECGQANPPAGPFNGYAFGARPGTRVGYVQVSAGAGPFAPSAGGVSSTTRFDFLDGWLTAAWSRALQVTVRGYRGGALVNARTLTLQYDVPLFVTFNFTNVDAVTFDGDLGVPDFSLGGIGNQIVLDDLRVDDVSSVVPEPAVALLLAPGLALVALVRRRRR
ncbi:MAG: hypothetical protein HY275_15470 [Gemmatimonadetes bacterium]|nr:hypothetical protein [Gemmatimonadota bacterium]